METQQITMSKWVKSFMKQSNKSIKNDIIDHAKLIPGHDNTYIRNRFSLGAPLNIMYIIGPGISITLKTRKMLPVTRRERAWRSECMSFAGHKRSPCLPVTAQP